jgi:ADP-ribose pyrophosphatase YjhB (NUDIX family)
MPDAPVCPLVHVSAAVLDGDRVLLVQETKPAVRGKWNFPGGHVERGESIILAAPRELQEETGLSLEMSWLVGIYMTPISVRFVLGAAGAHVGACPGDDIMACRTISLAEVARMPEAEMHSVPMMRRIFADLQSGRRYPLDMLVPVGR